MIKALLIFLFTRAGEAGLGLGLVMDIKPLNGPAAPSNTDVHMITLNTNTFKLISQHHIGTFQPSSVLIKPVRGSDT